jgi:lipid-binding SYLF domain-containing protein
MDIATTRHGRAGLALALALLGTLLLIAVGPREAGAATVEERREDTRAMAHETLERLYRSQPRARESIESAAGYAVFSNFGLKIFLAGGGGGSGIVVDNRRGRETFMKMVEVQAGLGFGLKKFRQVFVFENRATLDNFVDSGWEFGGQTTAAAKIGDQGEAYQGAISVSPGVWVYQLTDEGLALELTGKGTKYYRDDELN